MSNRPTELEERRRSLIAQADWQRQRLQADSAVASHWAGLARMAVFGARRAARLYRYWNRSTHS